jgi:type VI secretion system protein ImpB
MPESIQHKLDRVRRPRVQITYDVETLGSIVKTELPFVVGIMADLSGNSIKGATPRADQPLLKDRKFVEIDRDNFDQIMEKLVPKVSVKGVDLEFKTLDDFNPINVLRNVPKLQSKFESRTRLSNLLAKLDGNPTLQKNLVKAIRDLIGNTTDKQALQSYIDVNLHDQENQAEAAAPFNAEALVQHISAAKQKELKNYIVERYPDTITPDVVTLAAGVTDTTQKNDLKTHILSNYPYVVTASAATLAAAVTVPAQQTELQTHIATKYPPAPGAPADLTAAVAALNVTQEKELRAHIAGKYPDTVTDTVEALVGRLRERDKDDLKEYILNNCDTVPTKTAREGLGSRVTPIILMNSLKANEKRELADYIAKTYPTPVVKPEGDNK